MFDDILYDIFGVVPNRDSSDWGLDSEVLSARYAEIMSLLHPDNCKLTQASKSRQVVEAAYNLLMDQDQELAYRFSGSSGVHFVYDFAEVVTVHGFIKTLACLDRKITPPSSTSSLSSLVDKEPMIKAEVSNQEQCMDSFDRASLKRERVPTQNAAINGDRDNAQSPRTPPPPPPPSAATPQDLNASCTFSESPIYLGVKRPKIEPGIEIKKEESSGRRDHIPAITVHHGRPSNGSSPTLPPGFLRAGVNCQPESVHRSAFDFSAEDQSTSSRSSHSSHPQGFNQQHFGDSYVGDSEGRWFGTQVETPFIPIFPGPTTRSSTTVSSSITNRASALSGSVLSAQRYGQPRSSATILRRGELVEHYVQRNFYVVIDHETRRGILKFLVRFNTFVDSWVYPPEMMKYPDLLRAYLTKLKFDKPRRFWWLIGKYTFLATLFE